MSELKQTISVYRGIGLALAILFSPITFAQQGPQNLNVSGGLFLPTGQPVTNGAVNFRLEIWDKTGTCMLYTEEHLSQDLSSSKGGFSLPLGKGSSANNLMESSAVLSAKIFQNNGVIAGGWTNCPSGANLASGDERLVRVYYNLGAGYVAMSPDVPIASAAYAMVAESLQGKAANDFIQVKDDVATDLTQANVENVFGAANYARLQQLLNPTAAIGFSSQRLSNLSDPSAAQDAATKNYTDSRLAGQTIDLQDVAPGFGGGKVLTWDQAQNKWVAQSPSAMGVAGGDLTGNYPNPSVANLAIGTSKLADNAVTSAKLNATGIATNRILITDSTTGATVTYANCANDEILKYVTGTGWQCATVASLSAVTSVAGKTGAVTLNAMDINGLGTAAVHNVGVGATEVPELDALGKLAYSTIPLFQGDVTGAIDNNIVTRIQGRDVAATSPNVNEVLRWNGSRWEPQVIADNGITALTGDISAAGNGSVVATLTNGVVTTPKMFTNPGVNRLVATDSSSGATLTAFSCNLNEMMQWTASGWACVSVSTAMGGSVILNDGNSFAGPMTIGTNNSQNLFFETNGSPSMTVTAGGYVGVGTTSPNRIFETAGPMRLQPSALPGSPGAGDLVVDSGSSNILKYHNGTNWVSVASSSSIVGTTGYMAQFTGSGAVGNSPVFVNAGSVGVGTTNPASAFDVNGQLTLSGTNRFINIPGDASTSAGGLKVTTPIYGADTGFDLIANGAAGQRLVYTYDFEMLSGATKSGATSKVMFKNNGNVGIGTTSPNRLLEVGGPIRVQPGALPASPAAGDIAFDSGASNALKFHDGTNWVTVNTGSGFAMAGANADITSLNALTNINGASIAVGNSATTTLNVGGAATGNLTATFGANSGTSSTTVQSGTGGLTLSAAGTAVVTSTRPVVVTPGSLPAGNTAGMIAFDSAASNTLKFNNGSSWTSVGNANASGAANYISKFNGAASLVNSALYESGGNVGIGTTSPSAKLTIQGNSSALRIETGSDPTNYYTTLTTNWDANERFALQVGASKILGAKNLVSGTSETYLASFNGISFAPNATNPTASDVKMFINTSGNVGIGTTSPSGALDAAGAIYSGTTGTAGSLNLRTGGGAVGPMMYLGAANEMVLLNNSNSKPIIFSVNPGSITEAMRITPTGSLGIGTTSPNRLLEVAGPIRVQPGTLPLSPAAGDIAFDSGAANTLKFHNGSNWVTVNTGSGFAMAGANSDITSLNALTNINGASIAVGNSATTTLNVGGAATGNLTATFGANSGTSSTTVQSGTGGLTLSAAGTSVVTSTRPLVVTPGSLPAGNTGGMLAFDSAASNALKFNNGTSWTTVGNTSASGTANYLSKFNGTASLVNSALYETGGNVGVGTTSPNRQLEVAGAIRVQPAALPASPAAGDLAFDSGNGNTLKFHNGSTWVTVPSAADVSGTTGYIPKFITASSIGNSPMFVSGSNVGIGTSSPTYVLDVAGGMANFASGIQVAANTGVRLDSANGVDLYGYSNSLRFRTNSYTERMRIEANGNVGIGTTSPNRLLEVAGAIRVQPGTLPVSPGAGDIAFDSSASNTMKFHNGSNWVTVTTGTGYAAAGANADITSLNALTNINGASIAVGNSATTTLNIGGAATGALTTTVGSTASTSSTTVQSGTGGLTLSASGTGVVTSTRPLVVAPGTLPAGNTGGMIAFDSSAANTLKFNNGTSWVTVPSAADVSGTTGYVPKFLTASSIGNSPMFISGSNVGIGSTSPNRLLEVAGAIRIQPGTLPASPAAGDLAFDSAASNTLKFNNGTSWTTVGNASASGSANYLSKFNGAASLVNSALYETGGNIGLGTTSPNRLLEVAGTARLTPSTLPGSPGAGDIAIDSAAGNSLKYHNGTSWISLAVGGTGDFKADGSVAMTGAFRSIAGTAGAPGMTFVGDTDNGIFAPAADNLAIATSGLERLRVSSSGYVGVGTTNPSYPLDVNGVIRSRSDIVITKGSSAYIGTFDANDLRLGTSSNDRITILNSSGNVGIGTTSPNRLLEVAGPIRVQPGTLPASPAAGDIAFDSAASNTLKFHNGANWVTVTTGTGWAAAGANSDITSLNTLTNINGASLSIGNSATTALNLGSSATGALTTTVGSTASTSSTTVQSGTGGLTLSAAGTGVVTSTRPVVVNPGSLPAGNTAGMIAFDSAASNTLKFNNGTAWTTVGNASASGTANYLSKFSGTASLVNSALFETGGNIGLGTTSPNRLLEVAGTARLTPSTLPGSPAAGDIAIDSAAGNSLKYHNGTSWISLAVGGTGDFKADGSVAMTGALRHLAGTAGAPGMTFVGDTANGAFAPAANNFAIATSGTERMRVLSGGNIGVGTTNPLGPLHIFKASATAGNIIVESNGSTATTGIDFYDGGGARFGYVGLRGTGSAAPTPAGLTYYIWSDHSSAPMVLGTNNAERVRITTAGNVGIGTTSPNRLLEVAGTARLTPSTLPGSPGAGDIAIDSAAGNSLKYHNGTSWISLAVGGTGDFKADGSVPMTGNLRLNNNWLSGDGGSEGVFVTSAGKVGIGTSGATQTLALYEGTNSTNVELNFYGRNAAAAGRQSTIGVNPDGEFFGIDWANNINNPAFVVYKTGAVGIGVTTPARALHVSGPIRINPAALPSSPAAGDIAFDSAAANALKFHNGTNWVTVNTGTGYAAAGANSDITSLNALTNINGASITIGNSATTALNLGSSATGALTTNVGSTASTSSTTVQSGTGGLTLSAAGTGVVTSTRPVVVTPGSLPAGNTAGMIAFDSAASNTLKFNNGTAWTTVGNSSASGTANYLSKFNGTASLVNSALYETSGNIGVGTTSPNRLLEVAGTARLTPSTLPGSPGAGDIAIDSAAGNSLKYHNGTSWISLAVGGTGDFKADGSVAMTGALRHLAGSASAPGMTFVGDADNGIFAPAADNLAIATSGSEKLRILANGNIGIGTSAPTQKLDVTSGIFRVKNSDFVASSTGTFLDMSLGASSGNTYAQLQGYTNGGINPANILLNPVSGNVGIGTTSPNRLLEVAGPMRVQPGTLPASPAAGDIAFDSAASNTLKFHNGANWVTVTTGTGYAAAGANSDITSLNALTAINGASLSIGNSATTALNLGSSATGALTTTVGSTASTSSTTVQSGTGGLTLSAAGTGVVTSTRPVVVTPGSLPAGNTGGMIAFDSAASNTLKYNNGTSWTAVGNASATGTTNYIGKFTGANALGNSALYDNAGNIGIGTTAAARLLQVAGAVRLSPTANPASPAAGDMYIDSGASNGLKYHNGTNWVSIGSGSGDFLASGTVPMTGNLRLNNNWLSGDGGNEGVFVSSTGNVGIGTTNPGNILSVSNASGSAYVAVDSAAGAFSSGIKFQRAGANKYSFYNTTSDQLAIYDYINSYAPFSFHTANSAGQTYFATFNNTGSGQLGMVVNNSTNPTDPNAAIIAQAGNYPLILQTNNTEAMRITNIGNVGIGVSAPSRLLHVAGAMRLSPVANPASPAAGDMYIDSGASNGLKYHNGTSWVTLGSGSGDFLANGSVNMTGTFKSVLGSAALPGITFVGDTNTGVFSPAADNVAIATSGVEQLRILANGNVGIGTTSPGRLLHVNGPMRLEPAALPGTPAAGDMAIDSGASNAFKWYNGSSWQTVAAGGTISGLTTGRIPKAGSSTSLTDSVMTESSGKIGIGTTSPNQGLEVVAGGTGLVSAASISNGSGANAGYGTALDFQMTSAKTVMARIGGLTEAATSNDGAMVFYTRAGGVTANEKMRLTSSGYLGIGTTSPNRMLEVSGMMRLAPAALPGSPGAGDLIVDSGASNALKYHNGSNWVSLGSGSGDFMKDGSVSMTGNLRLNNNWLSGDGGNEGVYVTVAGKVGVGNSSPATRLDVTGDVNISGDYWIGSTSVLGKAASNVVFGDVGLNGLTVSLFANSAERLTINSSGYVGIGTTAPANKLDVVGSASVTANSGSAFILDTPAASQTTAILMKDGGAAKWQIFKDSSNRLGIYDYAKAANVLLMNPNGDVALTPTGNVGIGVSSPARQLHVAGAMRLSPVANPASPAAGDMYIDSSASNGLRYHNGTSWVTLGSGSGDFLANGSVNMTGTLKHVAGSASAPGMTFVGDTDNGIFAPAADNLAIATSGSEKLRVLANGNVGVGTTAPSTLFSVGSTSQFQIDSNGRISTGGAQVGNNPLSLNVTTSGLGIAMADRTLNGTTFLGRTAGGALGGNSGWIGFGGDGTTTNNWLDFSGYGPTSQMRITSSGNVGIGLTGPARLLQVAGAIRLSPTANPASPAAGDMYIDSGASNGLRYHNGSSWVTLGSGSGDFLANGSVNMTGTLKHVAGSASTPGMTFVGDTDNGIFAPAADNLAIATSGSEKLRVLANGNVGIGTTSPGGMLHIVNSSAGASGASAAANANDLVLDRNGSGGMTIFSSDAGLSNFVMGSPSATSASILRYDYTNNQMSLGTNRVGGALIFKTSNWGERMRLDSSGNVGIGLTAPTRLLQVAGAMRLSPVTNPGSPNAGDMYIDSAASNGLKYHNGTNWVSIGSGSGDFMADGSVAMSGALRHLAGSASAPGMTFVGDTDNGIFAPAADTLAIATTGVERLRILPTGYVGIGNTNPSYKVVVDANTNGGSTSTALRLNNLYTGGYGGGLRFGLTNGVPLNYDAGYIGVENTNNTSNDGGRMSFWTAASGGGQTLTRRMTLDDAGYLGIGVTTPLRVLHTAGPIRIAPTVSPASPAAGDVFIDSAASNGLKYHNGTSWVAIGSGSGDFMKDGSVAMTGNFNAGGNRIQGGSTSGGSLIIESTSHATKGNIILAPEAVSSNWVGIGTSAPSDTVHIKQNWTNNVMGLRLENAATGSNSASKLTLSSAAGNTIVEYGGSGYGTTWTSGALISDNSFRWNNTNSTPGLGNANDKMTLTSGGNLGIGTTAPSRLLQVAGAIRLSPVANPASPAAGDMYIDSGASNGLKYHNGTAWVTLGSGSGDFLANGTVNMTGTFKSVAGTAALPGITFVGDTNTGVFAPAADNVGIATSGVERMRVLANGNVGIGTTNATSALTVIGAIDASTQFLGNASDTVSTPSFSWTGDTTTGIWRPAASTIAFSAAGSEKVRLTSAGNLGVGTTAPTRLLQVAGAMKLTPVANPASPTAGDMYIDSGASNGLKYHNGTAWVTLGSGSGDFLANGSVNMTGTLKHVAGSASAPGMTFVGDTDNGIFAPAADNLAIATSGSEKLRVLANGFVGIGTTSPSYLLDIQSSTNSSQFHFNNSSSDVGGYLIGNSTGGAMTGNTAFNGTNWIAKATTASIVQVLSGRVVFNTDSGLTVGSSFTPSERMRIDSSGNVGIGTPTPARLLQVAGPIRLSPAANPASPAAGDMYIDSGASNGLKYHNGTAWVTLGSGSGDFLANGTVNMTGTLKHVAGTAALPGMTFVGDTNTGIFAPAADNVGIATSGLERLRVIANGNIGIGTTSPNFALDVAGTINSGGSFRGGMFDVLSSSTSAYVGSAALTIPAATNNAPTVHLTNGSNTDNGTGVLAFTINNAAGVTQNAYIAAASTTGAGVYNPYMTFGLQTGSASYAEKIRLTNTGLGIGTSTPARLLNVAGAMRINPTTNPGTPTAGDIYVDSAAANALKYNNGTTWVSLTGGGSGDFMANGTVQMTGNIRLNNNWLSGDGGNEGVYVTAAGNVGIGTTNPISLLSNTTANIADQPGTATTTGSFVWAANANNYAAGIYNSNAGSAANGLVVKVANAAGTNRLLTLNGAGTDYFAVTGNGLVGIGTTSPLDTLDVRGNLYSTGTQLQFENGGTRTYFQTTGIDSNSGSLKKYGITNTGGASLGVNTNNPASTLGVNGGVSVGTYAATAAAPSNGMIVSGNVGIGTTSPNNLLDVSSSGTSGPAIQITSTDTGGRAYALKSTGSAASAGVGKLAFRDITAGADRMVIDSSGYVGIGTTSPSVALDVVGDIEYTGTITDVSDRRLKENIQPLNIGLDILRQLPVYSYTMKNDPKKKVEYGVMAQDLRELVPNLTSVIDPVNGYIGVNYIGLIPWSIRAIQEVDRDVASVKAQNEDLKTRVEKLEEQNRILSEQVQKLIELHQKSGH